MSGERVKHPYSSEECPIQLPTPWDPTAADLRLPTPEHTTALTAAPDPNGHTRILIYESLISFLKKSCGPRMPELQLTLDGYLRSMASENFVKGVVESLEFRNELLAVSSNLGLANDPNLRKALRTDEERIVTLLVSIFNCKTAEDLVLRLEGGSAQSFLDVVQDTLDRGFLMAPEHSQKARRIIRKLSETCDKLPSSLFITGVSGREEHPTFGGGYGDIYRASYGNTTVALKHMRHFLRGSDLRRLRLKFGREALLWKELHHPHILPFLGIDRQSFPSSLCMVSPWMEHGTILEYLKSYGRENVDLDQLLFEVAQGLHYLHSHNLVHGDLRGANILINQDWSACLADFGLSVFSNATSSMHTSTRAGCIYWMAPELIDPDRFGYKFARTPATDVYAFGCVCIEVYTGRPPFSDLSDAAALFKIANGDRAGRPSGTPAISDLLWQYIAAYWTQDPATRPVSEFVVHNMRCLTLSRPTRPLPPLPEMQSAPPVPSSSVFSIPPANILDGLSSSLSSVPPGREDIPPNQDLERVTLLISPDNRLPNGAPPALNVLNDISSLSSDQSPQTTRKKSSLVFGGIFQTLGIQAVSPSSSFVPAKRFWGRDREKGKDRDRAVELEREARERDRDRGRERRDEENELIRKIGFLTATASEDWTLLLDVCDHASANESNAKEAVRALRRELKSGEPAAQLAAARLWAIMLRNSSDTVTFISQSTSRKFLDTLEDLLTSSRTSPVVRERVMDVLAAAAYASGTNKDAGFRGLWRRVKPQDKPEEGVPFDAEDAMFNPPLGGGRVSAYDYDTSSSKKSDKLYRDHEHGIIPPEEDMRRLFQECKIGVGNATLLSQALAIATPEDLRNTVITEFHKKCMDSQELIFTQIPWASAGAERSRAAMDQEDRDKERDRERKRKNSVNTLNSNMPNGSVPDLGTPLSTREEELHAELLSANEELIEALKLYDDLKRVAIEREAENRSRKVRMVPRLHADAEGGTGGGSLSHLRSRSPTRVSVQHPQVIATAADLTFRTEAQAQAGQQTLAPPPAPPHGRLPGAGLSRTPSQAHPDLGARAELANGFGQIFGQLVMG